MVFGSRAHAIVTMTMLAEVGIAGWVVGYGALWLLGACAAVTAADSLWGMTRRRVLADLVGVEVAAVLVMVLGTGADPLLSVPLAAACLAWLVRPDRHPQRGETAGAA